MCKYSDRFIRNLKELQAGDSVSAFARRIGIKQQTLDACLKGQRKPSVEMVYTISCKLGVSTDWLLGLSDARTASKTAAETPRSVRSRPGVLDPNQALRDEIDALKRRVNALESSTSMACG